MLYAVNHLLCRNYYRGSEPGGILPRGISGFRGIGTMDWQAHAV